LEKHRDPVAFEQIHNARGKPGYLGFDEAFDTDLEEYDTGNAY
jgi:hypothetical protein